MEFVAPGAKAVPTAGAGTHDRPGQECSQQENDALGRGSIGFALDQTFSRVAEPVITDEAAE